MTNIEVTYVVTVKQTFPLEAYGGETAEEAREYEYNLDDSDKAQVIAEALSVGRNVEIFTAVRIDKDA